MARKAAHDADSRVINFNHDDYAVKTIFATISWLASELKFNDRLWSAQKPQTNFRENDRVQA